MSTSVCIPHFLSSFSPGLQKQSVIETHVKLKYFHVTSSPSQAILLIKTNNDGVQSCLLLLLLCKPQWSSKTQGPLKLLEHCQIILLLFPPLILPEELETYLTPPHLQSLESQEFTKPTLLRLVHIKLMPSTEVINHYANVGWRKMSDRGQTVADWQIRYDVNRVSRNYFWTRQIEIWTIVLGAIQQRC